jgi:hypothetical protein
MDYGLAMLEVEEPHDKEDAFGSTLAVPPLYVLRTIERCPRCGMAQNVYAFGGNGFYEAEDGFPTPVFRILCFVRSVPDQVLDLLKAHCPSLYLDHAEDREPPYLMNHCGCGTRLDDDYLHGKSGAAFWPRTLAGYGHIKPILLPIRGAIALECSYSGAGGCHYLDVRRAETW